ncbi:MAG: hypothetical protein KF830_16835 [Planctomycetes bacterium]|nr:hypothetical protein [Planctomycetota bacterium]
MKPLFPPTIALVALLAAPLAAQGNCPMQTTRHVPASTTIGPPQPCSGADYRIAEIEIRLTAGMCPSFVVYTPPHDYAVPSTQMTQVESIGAQAITMVTFRCVTRWLLFLPIGSTCEASRQMNVGAVHTLLTRPCATPGA